MVTNLKTNQRVDLTKTSAEIQMVKKLFGATPLIQLRDGKTVNLFNDQREDQKCHQCHANLTWICKDVLTVKI
jgi:hypothetical protein